MPVSAHLLRKLEESLGMDAAADLANVLDGMDAIPADVAELRHEMRREFEVIKARLDGLATKAEFAVLQTRLDQTVTKGELKDALLVQTRWILAGLATVLFAVLFKG